MESMNELILKLTSLADMHGKNLVIASAPAPQDRPSKYTITIGDSVYYTDFVNTSSLIDALMHHSVNLGKAYGQEAEEEA